jgi:glycosyltransferase involved in cell wall biosynthesis
MSEAVRSASERPDHPTVSVVLPTFEERASISDCLRSLERQTGANIIEILVVDGYSTDGTRELVGTHGAPVRLVDNPGVSAAAAMNVGIDEAVGDIICRADAHTVYAPDYVARCVAVLHETGATNVGGRMVPVGTTRFGRAVAAVTSSPFGIGPGAFHYATEQREVDTVYLGCWWRDTLVELGGYDAEGLQWAAEDQELNFRIRRGGGRIVLDPTIRSWYFPRDTPRALARQYQNYGLAKASTLAKHRSLPSWRPLAPAALVAATAVAMVWHPRLAVAGVGAHGVLCAGLGYRLSAEPGVDPARAAAVTAICHWSYGVGFWRGIGRLITRRGFDRRPRGRR